MTDDFVRAIFDDPALVHSNASLICPSEMVLIGSNTSICKESGNWEPDPSKVECRGQFHLWLCDCQSFIKLAQCGPPTLNGAMLPYTSTTEGANVILLCQKIDRTTLINDSYTVLTCSEDGNWEPNPGNFCTIATGTVIIIIICEGAWELKGTYSIWSHNQI